MWKYLDHIPLARQQRILPRRSRSAGRHRKESVPELL